MLGRELSVRSSAPAAKVLAVEDFVNSRLQEIGEALKNGDAQLILTLALLNTTEELIDLRDTCEHNLSLEKKLQGIVDKLESA